MAAMTTVDVSVALCTFNGAEYIEQQLRSLAAQTLAPGEIVVCDDRSGDRTVALVEQFARTALFPVRVVTNPEQMGVVKNFEQATRLCRGRYIALADQDDVWRPDKLEREVALIRQAEKELGADTPILVHSDLVVVDEDLATIHPSMLRALRLQRRSREPICTLLAQNSVTGCTAVFNRALVERALPFSEHAVMHDWWLAACAAAFGEVRTLMVPTVLYRQHGRNQVGAGRYWTVVRERLRAAIGGRPAKAVAFDRKIMQARALAARVAAGPEAAVRPDRRQVVERFAAAFAPGVGRWRRLAGVLRSGVSPQTLLLRIRFLLQVLIWSPDRARASVVSGTDHDQ